MVATNNLLANNKACVSFPIYPLL